MSDFEVTGLKELLRRLAKFDVRTQRKILRKATRASSSVVQKAIKRATPVGQTSKVRKSIGRKFKFYRASLVDIGVIGPQLGIEKGWIGPLIELGTKDRTIKDLWGRHKAGLTDAPVPGSAGRMPGKPFVEPAIRSVGDAALAKSTTALAKALEQEFKRRFGR